MRFISGPFRTEDSWPQVARELILLGMALSSQHSLRRALLKRSTPSTSGTSPSIAQRRSYTTVNLASAASLPYSGFQVSLLGTSSGVPTRSRGVTSIGLRRGAEHWLVDCGEGAQSRIRMSAIMNISRLSRIFITHLHGDHVWGLLGVVASNLIGNDSPTPLTIYGPPGLAEFASRALRNTYTSYPQHLLNIIELGGRDGVQPDKSGIFTVFERDDFLVRATHIKHTIPCLGYVFEEKTRRGNLNVDALSELGVKRGPGMRLIQDQWRNEEITLNGITEESTGKDKVVAREVIMSPPLIGRKIVVLGDTCDPYDIDTIASDACVLIHECTLPSGMERTASSRGHSTGSMAAKFAQHINARSLVLTHFSPRFTDDMLENERSKAASIFKGEVFAGADFDVFDVPLRNGDGALTTRYRYPFNEMEVDFEKDFPEALTAEL